MGIVSQAAMEMPRSRQDAAAGSRFYRVRMTATVGRTRSRRLPGAVLASVAAAGLLAGCAGSGKGSDGQAAAASTSSAASSSSGSVTGSTLTKGLLPAGAFGAQATVIGLTLEQLKQTTSTLGASTAGVQVSPDSCAAAVQGTAPDYSKVDDLAAQAATGSGGATIEALMTGGPAKGAVEKLTGAAAACPQATVTSPQGTVTLTFQSVPVRKMGDDAAAVQLTTALTKPDGTSTTVPALIGAVEDHGRLLMLVTAAGNGAAPDQAAFTALLEKAYATQAHALD
jgi:hypothetical protein